MSKKKKRPSITVIEPDGQKKTEYYDNEGLASGLVEIVFDVLKKVFK